MTAKGTIGPLRPDPVAEEVLARLAPQIGDDLAAYRNHVHRGLTYQLAMLGLAEAPPAIALAWAIHDAGIWTGRTWDYLDPSVALAASLVDALGLDLSDDEVARVERMVADHHRLRAVRDDPWVETFRLADRVDATRGVTLGTSLRRHDVARAAEAFPYLGFHRFLVRHAVSWAVRHPTDPAPMLRW